jgi:hypothetical protein
MFKFLFLLTVLTSQAWSKGSPMIESVIQDYFNGYQQADTTSIQNAFHPDTKLISVVDGKMDITEMKEWIKSLEERRLRGDFRKGILKTESIDITKHTASVKLNIRFKEFEFTDYLSLLQIDGQWLIVGKIYHYQKL